MIDLRLFRKKPGLAKATDFLCRVCLQVQAASIHHGEWEHDFEPWGSKLAEMTCPQCKKPFVLTWKDYGYDEKTKTINSGDDSTLNLQSCPSGGLYDVSIRCPHCDYEEEL